MFNLKLKIPREVTVAVSGGIDSMVALHFLQRNHKVTVAHYVHNSEFAKKELEFVTDYCQKQNIPIIIKHQKEVRGSNQSREEYWRSGRYEFLQSIRQQVVVATTLDDAVEWYVFSAAHGLGKYIKPTNANIIRPFIITTKKAITAYATKHSVVWLEDESNQDITFAARNRVRHLILPELLKVNPGLYKTVKKRIEDSSIG